MSTEVGEMRDGLGRGHTATHKANQECHHAQVKDNSFHTSSMTEHMNASDTHALHINVKRSKRNSFPTVVHTPQIHYSIQVL